MPSWSGSGEPQPTMGPPRVHRPGRSRIRPRPRPLPWRVRRDLRRRRGGAGHRRGLPPSTPLSRVSTSTPPPRPPKGRGAVPAGIPRPPRQMTPDDPKQGNEEPLVGDVVPRPAGRRSRREGERAYPWVFHRTLAGGDARIAVDGGGRTAGGSSAAC